MSNKLAGAEAMQRVTVRVHADRLEQFDDTVAESDEWANRSEAFRDLMAQVVGEGAPAWLPDDDQLATAYRVLRQNAKPDTGEINIEAAKAAVAEATKIEKEAVKKRVLEPLESRGLISPAWGRLYVRIPNE